MSSSRSRPVARTVLSFAALGVIVLVLVGGFGIAVLRKVATDQSIREARRLTAVSARIVQPRVDEGILTGDAASTLKVASIVNDALLHPPIIAVKIYSGDGTILYSSDLTGLGDRIPAAAAIASELAPGEIFAERADPSAPENRDLQSRSILLTSYAPLHTPGGTPILLELYQRFSSVADNQRQLLSAFAPVLLVAMAAMMLLLVPLAWGLARRVRRASQEREAALSRAIHASDRERRRIAGDIHDGPVQELAGLAMRLSADSSRAQDPEERQAYDDASEAVRASIRTLRSAIVGVYPPNLQTAGLGPALSDLTARLPSEGLQVVMEVADPAGYGQPVDELVYRACQEALRNVQDHAEATRVTVRVHRDGSRAVLEVEDDGRGISDAGSARGKEGDHVGLQILGDVVRDGGGTVSVGAANDRGTILRMEVPIP